MQDIIKEISKFFIITNCTSEVEYVECIEQEDGWSCGFYTLLFLCVRFFNLTQEDIPNLSDIFKVEDFVNQLKLSIQSLNENEKSNLYYLIRQNKSLFLFREN